MCLNLVYGWTLPFGSKVDYHKIQLNYVVEQISRGLKCHEQQYTKN